MQFSFSLIPYLIKFSLTDCFFSLHILVSDELDPCSAIAISTSSADNSEPPLAHCGHQATSIGGVLERTDEENSAMVNIVLTLSEGEGRGGGGGEKGRGKGGRRRRK